MEGKKGIDWSASSLVESKEDVQGGTPVIRGTRMPVQAILDNLDYGVTVDEVAEQFEIRRELVQAVMDYAHNQRVAHSL
jgi:uncharacterized protein (DUF433 family)